MPNRYMVEFDMELDVKVQSGYCLKFDLVNELASQGLVLATTEGITEGPIKIKAINSGRNVVTLREGIPFVKVRLEKITKLEWE
jgi:hypothetical protein